MCQDERVVVEEKKVPDNFNFPAFNSPSMTGKPNASRFNYLFFFLSGRCVRADPATLFTFLEVLLLRSKLEAVLPTRLDVFSFLAIFLFP
jgi:hypothetical protein